MEVDEGGEGYGFARRNNSVRKKVGRSTAAHSDAPAVPVAYGAQSQKPAWVWLLIGFLLGTGGTLLTASFWLPAGSERHIAMPETGDHPSERTAVDEAVSEPLEPEADELKTETSETLRDEPGSETTPIAALDIERQAGPPNGDEARLGPDDIRVDSPDLPEKAGTPDTEAGNEVQRPAGALDANDDADQKPLGNRRTTTLSYPEQALAALVSDVTPTETSELTSSPDDRPGGADLDPPEQAESPPIRPGNPISAETPSARSAAALPDGGSPPADGLRQNGSPQSTVTEAVPSNGASRRELPPRIRRALLAARANSANGENGSRLYRVQLAAVDDEAAARVFWRETNERLPGVFADVEPIFDRRLVDERQFLRVWVGAFDNRLDANGYCGWLKLQGQDCFVTRVDNL